jgi:sugar fermentation stimulation protein A
VGAGRGGWRAGRHQYRHPNLLAAEAIAAGAIPELAGYGRLTREVRYGANSRIDLLLTDPSRPDAYVEVKNVHLMRRPGLAEFPDSVTKRGAKHLDELAGVAAAGKRAAMLYLVQRNDARSFALAADIDPAYARAFDRARAAGVEMLAYACRIAPEEIAVGGPVPFAP